MLTEFVKPLINALPSYAGDGPEIWPRTLDSTRTDVRWKNDYIYSMLYSVQCQLYSVLQQIYTDKFIAFVVFDLYGSGLQPQDLREFLSSCKIIQFFGQFYYFSLNSFIFCCNLVILSLILLNQ